MKSTITSTSASSQIHEPEQKLLTDALMRYFVERGYARPTALSYVSYAGHFLHWIKLSHLNFFEINDRHTLQFLDDHLPHCSCGWSKGKDRREAHAALGHMLVVLRTLGVAVSRPVITTPVDEELLRFDDYMGSVRGLGLKTRKSVLRITRVLLLDRFGDRPVVFTAIKPLHIRSCFARLTERCRSPLSTGSVVSALRGYFRYRATCGDAVYGLSGVLAYPANWQLAVLPKTLADEEIQQLLQSLDLPGPSMRRSAAIVRCAVDLGLRSIEIATLSLDDINWNDGIITLRKTKSRREQFLPLPEMAGQAIAAYLKYERPKSTHREIFLRHTAPNDDPIGPDLIRKTIRLAYKSAGLPYTKSHLLRHTIARRLLDSGGSLKEIADVLRHQSLNTTLIYAKLDSRNLRHVALPWPGRNA